MQKNVLWGMIVVLLVTNGLTFALWNKDRNQPIGTTTEPNQPTDIVAKVGKEEILYDEFIAQLESKYGTDMLKEIIDQQVVYQMAEKENIQISEEEVERELTMMKSLYQDSVDGFTFSNEDQWKKEIKYLLLLEELLTQDIVVEEKNLQAYYDENQDLFKIPQTYHISHIIVKEEDEAMAVIEELEGGSSFSAIAMERSLDPYTASEGGNLGFITGESMAVPAEYYNVLDQMQQATWSNPIKVEEGFAILFLHESIEGRTYSFEEVKDQIRRQMAMQQTENTYTAEPFWSEIGVEWIYGEG